MPTNLNKSRALSNFILIVGLVVCCFSVSCVSTKSLKYFNDLPDTTSLNTLKIPEYQNEKIKPFDVLSINVQTIDPSLVTSINSISGAISSPTDLSGYMVDSLGYIQVPMLGSIKVAGETTKKANEIITEIASKYFVNPVVTVRNKGFKITILGEVGRPGIVYIATPKATVLDLMGISGDFTINAERKSVLLLRQNETGSMSTIRIDMTKSDILKSPYYYLKGNDVFIVSPNRQRALASDIGSSRLMTFVSFGISLITTLVVLITN
jgi:polysaccharide biosynthesis/export protein